MYELAMPNEIWKYSDETYTTRRRGPLADDVLDYRAGDCKAA